MLSVQQIRMKPISPHFFLCEISGVAFIMFFVRIMRKKAVYVTYVKFINL